MRKEELDLCIKMLREDKKHVLVVGGNIFDTISFGSTHDSYLKFLQNLTEKSYPNFVTYDIFSGVKVVRGNKELLSDAEKEIRTQSGDALARAMQEINQSQKDSSQNSLNPLRDFHAFDRMLHDEHAGNTALVIKYADQLFGNSGTFGMSPLDMKALEVAVQEWTLDERIHKKGNMIVFLGKNIEDFPKFFFERCGCVHVLRIGKPAHEERAHSFEETKTMSSSDANVMASAASGLSLKEITRISSVYTPEMALSDKISACFSAKRSILQEEYGDVLEVLEAKNGFDAIGGLEKPIEEFQYIAYAMRMGKTSVVPQGVLLGGPPGTGKTILVEALAKEAGVNLVRPLDLKNMFVGESERRMTRFQNALKDLTPVIVFIDELDQNQSGRNSFDGDSGVSRKLFQKMLTIMSDTSLRGKVLWIFATNRPDLIDPAMKRPGRCDIRIALLPPDTETLEKICHAAFVQYPDTRTVLSDFTPWAKQCDGYTGADMVEVVLRAWRHANRCGRSEIMEEDMDWACGDYRPQMLDKTNIAFMTLTALNEVSSVSLLPDNWSGIMATCIRTLRDDISGRYASFIEGLN